MGVITTIKRNRSIAVVLRYMPNSRFAPITNSVMARTMATVMDSDDTNSAPNGEDGERMSIPNPTKYSSIFIAVPIESTPFTNPENMNVAPQTILNRTVIMPNSVFCFFPALLSIFEFYQSKDGIVYHVFVIGIYPFGNEGAAVMLFYLLGSV